MRSSCGVKRLIFPFGTPQRSIATILWHIATALVLRYVLLGPRISKQTSKVSRRLTLRLGAETVLEHGPNVTVTKTVSQGVEAGREEKISD